MFGHWHTKVANCRETHRTQGGAMSNQDKPTDTTIIVGASGSVGILPDGVFAKILGGSSPEPHQPDASRSDESLNES